MFDSISGVNPIKRIFRLRNPPRKNPKERVDEIKDLIAGARNETIHRIDELVGYPHPDNQSLDILGMHIDAKV